MIQAQNPPPSDLASRSSKGGYAGADGYRSGRAGDGSYDYLNALGHGGNLIPPMMVDTPYGLFPSDSWLADIDPSDPAPEIAIGRLPVTTSAELELVIAKLRARALALGSPWQSRVLLLADGSDIAGDFTADSNQIADLVPVEMPLSRLYLSSLTVAEARTELFNQINSGLGMISYIGHGGFDRLAAEGLLTSADLASLSNQDLPVVLTAMTCVTGNFALPGYPVLSELLLRQSAGAAAVWAPTGLSQNELAAALARAFYAEVFSAEDPRLGDAILDAAQVYEAEGRAPYIIDIYTLLGDPAMKLR